MCSIRCLGSVLLLLVPLSQEDRLRADPPTMPAVADDNHDQTTLQSRHTILVELTNRLYQQGDYEDAVERLKELLVLYEEMYPPSDYPDGHMHKLYCYLDLCRLCDKLRKNDDLLQYARAGLGMARRLFPKEKFPHGHFAMATAMGHIGKAHYRAGNLTESRKQWIESHRILSRFFAETGDRKIAEALAATKSNIGVTFLAEGNPASAKMHLKDALDLCRRLFSEKESPLGHSTLSHCLFHYGKALRTQGDCLNALPFLEEAYESDLRRYIVNGFSEAKIAVVNSLIELSVVHRVMGDYGLALKSLDTASVQFARNASCRKALPTLRAVLLTNYLELARAKGNMNDVVRVRTQIEELISTGGCVAKDHGEEIDLADLIVLVGNAHHFEGEFVQAENCLQRGLASFLELFPPDIFPNGHYRLVAVHYCLGNVYQDMGDYARANTHFFESLRIARRIFRSPTYPEGHGLLCAAILNMATHCWLVGDTEVAVEMYRKALAMAERLYPTREYPKGHENLQQAYSAWANILVRERRFEEAADYFNKAHQIMLSRYPVDEFPNGHDELAESWRDLGRLKRDQGRFDEARELFQKALTSYERRLAGKSPDNHLSIALMLSEFGRTTCAEGDVAAAARYHQDSLEIRERLFPSGEFPNGHPILATALRELGVVRYKAGSHEDAYRLLGRSAEMEVAIARSFLAGGSEALLLNLAARKLQSLDVLLSAWRRTGRSARDVYPFVWQRRGLVPGLLAQRNRLLRQTESLGRSDDRAQYLTVRRELSRSLLVSVTNEAAQNAKRIERLRRLNARKEELERRVTRDLKSRGYDSPLSGAETLAQHLPADAVFVDFVAYSEGGDLPLPTPHVDHRPPRRLGAFVVASSRPVQYVDLGDADAIDRLVAQWRGEVVSDDQATVTGRRLRSHVWDPVRGLLPSGIQTVYMASDGPAAFVAWGALPGSSGGVLLEQYAFASVPSGEFLHRWLSQPTVGEEQSRQVLVVGDVDYGRRSESAGPAEGLNLLSWRPLAGSRHELRAVYSYAGDRHIVPLTGGDATKSQLMHYLPTSRWVHLATHGFFVDADFSALLGLASAQRSQNILHWNRTRGTVLRRNPFVRSGLALAGANLRPAVDEQDRSLGIESLLTAEDVVSMDGHRIELAVLSACESGRGDMVERDGVFGMPVALHVAGVRNVISALWHVNDAATAELLADFYRRLWSEEQPPLAALRAAQLAYLQRIKPRRSGQRGPVLDGTVPLPKTAGQNGGKSANPIRYWAGFTLSGPGF